MDARKLTITGGRELSYDLAGGTAHAYNDQRNWREEVLSGARSGAADAAPWIEVAQADGKVCTRRP